MGDLNLPGDIIDGATADGLPRVAFITGASSGIGMALVEELLAHESVEKVYAGCRRPADASELQAMALRDARLEVVELDVTRAEGMARAAAAVEQRHGIDLLVNTAGVLHNDKGLWPEKRLSEVNTDDLLLAYDVNALGAIRLAIAFEPLLRAGKKPKFISLSARVGSIGDNRLGGWYAYRASKAALNMLLRTLAIEWGRLRPAIVCAGLHPGTVATALSKPFSGKSLRPQPVAPAQAARNLLSVIVGLTPEESGGFYAWDGEPIPW